MPAFANFINDITAINLAIGAPDLARPVSGLLNATDKTISIAFLGQFKSGKSSLVNSLMDESFLPVGVVPVTAIVTQLRFGEQPKLVIQYLNGRETETSLDELPRYVTEKQNPENVKKVARAIVEHPVLEPLQNISFVDTPGLGSLYKHNSETTQQWLPYTGAAIVCVSAERPLSEEDLALLKGVVQYCPDLAIVITKTDLFARKELDEIKQYVLDSVQKSIGRVVQVFEYSVHTTSRESRNILIEKLIRPLHQNSTAKQNGIIRHKALTAIDQSLVYTDLALQSAMKREAEKDAVNRILHEIRDNRHHQEREMLLSGASFKGEVRDKLEKLLLPYSSQIAQKLAQEFIPCFTGWTGSLYQVSRKYEQWLNEQIGGEINRIDHTCFDQINRIVGETASYYQYSALQFRQRLDDKLSQVFGVHLPEAYWQIDFSGIDRPDIAIYRAFDSHVDTLLFFLPMEWFRRLFFRHFYKQIAYEAEKNLHRYISDVTGKIIKTIDVIHKQALLYISNETATVENILQNTQSNLSEVQGYLEQLKKMKSAIFETNDLNGN